MQICHNVSASCTVYVNMSYNMVPVAVVVKPVYNVKQFLEPKKKKKNCFGGVLELKKMCFAAGVEQRKWDL